MILNLFIIKNFMKKTKKLNTIIVRHRTIDLRFSKLKKIPKEYENVEIDEFLCCYNLFKSLKGCPKINYSGYFSNNLLESLEGCPEEFMGFFDCCQNNLKNLKESPRKVYKSFFCSHNKLNTLFGGPKELGDNFYFIENYLFSMDFMPSFFNRMQSHI